VSAVLDPATLVSRASQWLDQDPDPETRAELAELIDRVRAREDLDAIAGLSSRFHARLHFGTAGLRAELGAGPARMNRVVVAQTAAGLASFLISEFEDPSIVIGFDARKNSRVFALDTAEIMAGAGIRTTVLPGELPTPVLAYAVRKWETSAGVMVTASHNPAQDNGYKVYLGGADGGSQIVPPSDGAIASAIEHAATTRIENYPRSDGYQLADHEIVDSYVARVLSAHPPTSSDIRYVYTPLHGVGGQLAERVFRAAGFTGFIPVAEQHEPDPTFPTVAFPNPEEPGALDLAIDLAARTGADLVIANDPDADRLAVAVPRDGGWAALAGNEIGLLLAERITSRHARASSFASSRTLACSLVSSPGLRAIAADFQLGYRETLTGFKWISRVPELLFGFEEALGYAVDLEAVRDKDGISAAVEFLALAAEARADGETIDDRMNALAQRYGAYASTQISIRIGTPDAAAEIIAKLRADPPTRIAGDAVTAVDDFANGFGELPPSDIIRLRLSGGDRVIIRPSGTEPKLKVYIDARSLTGDGPERRRRATAKVGRLSDAMRAILADGT